MLKLVGDNAYSLRENDLFQEPEAQVTQPTLSPQNSFVFHFQGFSSNLYVFRAKDLAHALMVEMTLEIKESFTATNGASKEGDLLTPVMSAHFPGLNMQKFNELIHGDEYLKTILTLQFQLKILEQLFLFCEEKGAVQLKLTIRDVDVGCLEIYRRFLIAEDQMVTEKGERIETTIPITAASYDKLIDFMDDVERNFQQTLWREQRFNPAIQEYLKAHSLPGL